MMTDPQYSGAARKIIQWGIAEAERKQLPIYVESSESARPIYEKHGFQVVDVFAMDLMQYGGSGVEKVTIMVRGPDTLKSRCLTLLH
ncbi:hypothetical protein BDV29DRAFT_169305 [Aspergillus leporis]|jgi:predicted GNAT family N-acyltransferase|uniref:N-acetyltransferase domain-containing protein n=1 Tax=Aspergillus leporis TaxID=41062 RepID=A0A5N5X807_9EURO|nr:hypothetical protein BDV29DRAFT_169305 [Aspergillus leporis]